MEASTHASTQQRLREAWFAVAEVSRDLSLAGLLDRVVVEAGHLCSARAGVLDVVDGAADHRLGHFASFGVPRADDGRLALVEMIDRSVSGPGVRGFVGVPVVIDGRTFAHLYLFEHRSGSGFSAEDEDVAGAFAASIGLVLGSAVQREKSERDRRWFDASAEISRTLLGPVSARDAWQLVVDRARMVSSATCAALLMPREDGHLVVEAVSGTDAEGVLGEVVAIDDPLVGRAATTGVAAVVPHTAVDRLYDARLTPGWPDLDTVQVVPIHDGARAGVLVVGWAAADDVDSWDLDPELPERFADQAAHVLQAAREQGERRRTAVFEDRDRISRDLHDVVIQRLFAIGMNLDQTARRSGDDAVADQLSSAIDGIDETIADLRRTISGLETDDADSPDVPAVLERLVDNAAELLGFRPVLTVNGPVTTQVSGMVREHVVAVAGEMLSNIVQHAHAGHATLDVSATSEQVVLTVTDDGRGLDPDQMRDGGNGMRNIRRRAELLGGQCEVSSEPGKGLVIRWSVPGVIHD